MIKNLRIDTRVVENNNQIANIQMPSLDPILRQIFFFYIIEIYSALLFVLLLFSYLQINVIPFCEIKWI